jgi:hypothetical protein
VRPPPHRANTAVCALPDCVRAVGGHYISKDIEGKIVVWQAMDGEVLASSPSAFIFETTRKYVSTRVCRSCTPSACLIVG